MANVLKYVLVLVQLLWGTVAVAEVSQEYHLKAAFMYNFARFIRWPGTALPAEGEHLNFCIVGTNPFEDILATIEKKKIGGRPIKVHYLQTLDPKNQCHLAFFSGAEAERIAGYADKINADATIAVSDVPDFVRAGGDIEFTREKGRIQFIINNSGLKRKGLTASSALLELAQKIY